MKKAIFCATALMFGAIGFAQNTSTVNETGTGNSATIHQTGANTSTVDQGYTDNQAFVTQVGSSNSDVDQQGDDNLTRVNQNGANNRSKVQQGNNFGADDNRAFVDQIGDNNKSDVMQRWDNNFADVDQNGNNNFVDLDQLSRPNDSRGNKATIDQDGDSNRSINWQETSAAGAGDGSTFSNVIHVDQDDDVNFSDISQIGEDNLAHVTQSGNNGFVTPPFGNEARVSQNGDMNRSFITQDDAAGPAGMANNWAKVTQTNNGAGPGNTSTVNQHGANTATVTQIIP